MRAAKRWSAISLCAVALELAFLRASSAQSEPITHETVRGIVNSHLADIKACFDVARKTHPEQSGKIMIDFTINDAGLVSHAHINEKRTMVKDSVLHECMLSALRGWKFPETRAGELADISYTFDLAK